MTLRDRANPVLAALWLASGLAMAQSAPPPAAPAPTDRAARDADKVYRMILMHADKPRRSPRDDRSAGSTTPAPGPTPSASAAPPPAPALPTISAEAAARVALPVRSETEVPAATSAVPVIAPEALSSMRAVPELAAVQAPRGTVALELVASTAPDFPPRLVRSTGPGSVWVEFEVAADGSVARATVVRSPNRGLNAAALAAVSTWRFKPPGTTTPGVVELKFE